MDKPHQQLSDDQREFLRPAVTSFTEAFTEIREKLIDLGLGDGDFSCLLCDCEYYVAPEGRPTLRCARSACGHGFTSHDVR